MRSVVLSALSLFAILSSACISRSVSPVPAMLPAPTLRTQCRLSAEAIHQRDPDHIEVVVSPPFVVAGDLPRVQLTRYLDETTWPAAQALWAQYVATKPHRPIVILLFAGERSYRRYAQQWYGDTHVPFFGYFRQRQNALLININTGAGTLVHELTHALTLVDFPDIPEWFDEGFASLFEAPRIDNATIRGRINWRLPELQAAIHAHRLRSLDGLIRATDFRGDAQSLNYAHARYFCLYLQECGLLTSFYRDFRNGADHDPTGAHLVAALFPNQSLEEVDRSFRAWVLSLRYPRRP